jgi:hypothetical protein
MLEFKNKGLDKFTNLLEVAEAAFADLSGRLCELRFDPTKPEQVQAAVTKMEKVVDERLSKFPYNPQIQQLALGLKRKLKDQIINGASQVDASTILRGTPLRSLHGTPFNIRGTAFDSLHGTPFNIRGTPARQFNRCDLAWLGNRHR